MTSGCIALKEHLKVGHDHTKNAPRNKDAAYLAKKAIGISVLQMLNRMVGVDAFPRIIGEP